MASTFTLLLAGFILLDLAHFGMPGMTTLAAIVLIFCALNAWYMMAHAILFQVYGKDVLPVGQPVIGGNSKAKQQVIAGAAESA
jgi:hypothetical protein